MQTPGNELDVGNLIGVVGSFEDRDKDITLSNHNLRVPRHINLGQLIGQDQAIQPLQQSEDVIEPLDS